MCYILKELKEMQPFKNATSLTISEKVTLEKHNKTLILVPYTLTGIK